MNVRVTSGSVFQVMMVISAGQRKPAVARKAIGWSTNPDPVSTALMTPTPGSSIQRQIRMATIGGVAHGTRRRTRLMVCSRYFRIVRLVSRKASARPRRIRTETPMNVSQTIVFHRTLRKSRLVTSSQ
jgi:hypothetical protein